MADSAFKHCLVAADRPPGPLLVSVTLPSTATVADAINQARVDSEGAATGIWGVLCDRSTVPRDGDRVEVYRPLTADPRKRRREQVVRAARRR